ncbi:MAG: MFS transporter, partial [Verrucomicrobiota bacterium]
IFNLTRNTMLSDILGVSNEDLDIKKYGEMFLGVFLLGGTFGGLLFGSLADRYGRGKIMVVTILMYSVFSGLTYFAETLGQVAVLRFLVAMGVGGEWAVAAALVAEVFPTRARAQASSIFHASSVAGTWAATIAALIVGTNWRYAYLIGIIPALLIVWVRITVKEPDQWKQNAKEEKKTGSLWELIKNPQWNKNAFLGMGLAAVGLGTFWAVVVGGQQLARDLLSDSGLAPLEIQKKSQFAYGIVQTIGGGIGLIMFGPISARLGRKKTFIWWHIIAFVMVPITCYIPQTYGQLLFILPVFGFFTLGMHAGYAVYFPELFPTRLRATGTSFCFNGGRIVAVPVLFFSGWLKSQPDIGLPSALFGLSLLFFVGALIMMFLPETKGQDLPD